MLKKKKKPNSNLSTLRTLWEVGTSEKKGGRKTKGLKQQSEKETLPKKEKMCGRKPQPGEEDGRWVSLNTKF